MSVIMPRLVEPLRHTVTVVCVVSESFREITVHISPWVLKIKAWNMQCELNAWNVIGEFLIGTCSFIVELWRDLLTSTAVASNSESNDKQIPHNRLLINTTVQSVKQIKRRPEWNLKNETAKATQPSTTDCVQLKVQPNLAPTPADYIAFPATVL